MNNKNVLLDTIKSVIDDIDLARKLEKAISEKILKEEIDYYSEIEKDLSNK